MTNLVFCSRKGLSDYCLIVVFKWFDIIDFISSMISTGTKADQIFYSGSYLSFQT